MHTAAIDLVLTYEVASPAHCCFNLEAAHHAGQRVQHEHFSVEPPVPLRVDEDDLGNRFVRLDAAPGPLEVRYSAQVTVDAPAHPDALQETAVSDLPHEVWRYLLPSRYCESDIMSRAAQQMFGTMPPGLGRVQAIDAWVHHALAYLPGSTHSATSAKDVFVQRAGVCRDFAHLGITLCRALNIPARLVVGYVHFEDPPEDFHAVFEAWLDGHWVLFDPTRMAPTERLVRVGTGRDAKDVAFATLFGDVRLINKTLDVQERERSLSTKAETALR